jgi:hypothetical protein
MKLCAIEICPKKSFIENIISNTILELNQIIYEKSHGNTKSLKPPQTSLLTKGITKIANNKTENS